MKLKYQNNEKFHDRQIGIEQKELENMLETVGCKSLDDLIDETIPKNIRLKKSLKLPEAIQEHEYIEEIRKIASKNKMFKSFIGLGYYDCITPSVIQRNIFENPGWYTQYTPYQAEISQGRLEALLNFQTMVSDLTGMEIANASLLDEATAAAEAMTMLYRLRNSEKVKNNANEFIVCENCFPQTIDVLKTRAEPLGIQLKFKSFGNLIFNDKTYGIFLQFPAEDGGVYDYQEFINKAHENGSFVAVAADLMSLLLLTPPGEFGADVVLGSSQRFGVPMGYGGPHAAYFATRNEFKRQVPGRIIGTSVDRYGNLAYRMALQTREQHIRREKATSNICTAQALLAIMASMYTVYHGPKKIKKIAERIHALARILNAELKKMG
jgi:glycine dehydrogenase